MLTAWEAVPQADHPAFSANRSTLRAPEVRHIPEDGSVPCVLAAAARIASVLIKSSSQRRHLGRGWWLP
jgi:hypothetical protein